jgi:hypothetical protein
LSSQEDLQGIALQLYVALVNSNKPLGPRELTRLADLSSPSVAYRNLQKLEELGLVEKDAFGAYTVKQRQTVKGHFWLGGRLFPRMIFYAFFFVGLLSVEVVLAVARLMVGQVLPYDFILLIIVTVIALTLFLFEGALSKITLTK